MLKGMGPFGKGGVTRAVFNESPDPGQTCIRDRRKRCKRRGSKTGLPVIRIAWTPRDAII